ncbi:hypothetical protein TWF718_002850 [Orbilia javanica]|uniref:F-box domain-containing protein n=1 Tax=Orbilia javanica TaxID=47235 RepID=A0AAN8MT38_9PEZI
MEVAAVTSGTQGLGQRSRLLEIPSEILGDIIEYVPKDGLSPLSQTCAAIRALITPKLFPQVLKIHINHPGNDWRNGHHHFTYPVKCAQGYLDDEKTEKILNSPDNWLKHVKEFRVVDGAHRYDSCKKMKHEGLKRTDELLLGIILKRLSILAEDLRVVVIPRNITLRMFISILDLFPNLRTLDAGIEARCFYRERRNKAPYRSFLTNTSSLNLEQLKFNFADDGIVRGIFLILQRCSSTLRDLRIAVKFYESVVFDGMENSGDEGPDYQRPKLRFPALEKLRILMNQDTSTFANWLLRLSCDFQKLSSLVIHDGKDVQDTVQYILANGNAPIHHLQLTQPSSKVDWAATDILEKDNKMNKVLEGVSRLHTLQLSDFGDWDLKTVYDLHRHSLKKLWLNCRHQHHDHSPEKKCLLAERIFGYDSGKYQFTIENWPQLEELTVPWFGVDKLPFHTGVRVLRLEHLHNKSAEPETYRDLLRPYITNFINHMAPAKPKLEVIVIMPNVKDLSEWDDFGVTYLCIDYDRKRKFEEGEDHRDWIQIDSHILSVERGSKRSYLFLEGAMGKSWDEWGRWGDEEHYRGCY